MMSVSLAEVEALNDCLLLMEASDEWDERCKEAVRLERHFAQMAGAVHGGEEELRELLGRCRAGLRQDPQDERLPARLALALGIAALRGAAAAGGVRSPGEDGQRCDAFLYRLYYTDGKEPGPQAETIRALLAALRQRGVIELHTFVAHTGDIAGWIERMGEWERSAAEEIRAFAEFAAAAERNPQELETGGELFYSSGDALLALLLRLRRGERTDGPAVRDALRAEPRSRYARAVRNGYAGMLSAQAFATEDAG